MSTTYTPSANNARQSAKSAFIPDRICVGPLHAAFLAMEVACQKHDPIVEEQRHSPKNGF